MHESLQPPKLERAPLEGVSRKKKTVVEMPQVTPEQIQLFAAKDNLEKEIEHLQGLYDLALEGEERDKLGAEIQALETNRETVLQSLAKARPEEYATEAAFEKMLKEKSPKEKEKTLETKEREKNDLEDEAMKLKNKLRLANTELKQVIGTNAARSGQLEQQIRETEIVLGQTEKRRIEAWKALKSLDEKKYGADADLEIAEAAHAAQSLNKASDQEIEDVLANLHEHIDQA